MKSPPPPRCFSAGLPPKTINIHLHSSVDILVSRYRPRGNLEKSRRPTSPQVQSFDLLRCLKPQRASRPLIHTDVLLHCCTAVRRTVSTHYTENERDTASCRIGLDWIGLDIQYSTVQYSTVQYSTVQYSTVLHCMLYQNLVVFYLLLLVLYYFSIVPEPTDTVTNENRERILAFITFCDTRSLGIFQRKTAPCYHSMGGRYSVILHILIAHQARPTTPTAPHEFGRRIFVYVLQLNDLAILPCSPPRKEINKKYCNSHLEKVVAIIPWGVSYFHRTLSFHGTLLFHGFLQRRKKETCHPHPCAFAFVQLLSLLQIMTVCV